MLINPVRMNIQSFLKLTVYSIITAITAWSAILLATLSFWNISYALTWRYALPTLEIKELYIAAANPLNFAVITYWVFTTLLSITIIYKNLKKQTEFLIELKYAIVFVTLLTQCFLIVNLYSIVSLTLFACGIVTFSLAVLFFWSVQKEKVKKIS